MEQRKVVITGMGAICPNGNSVEEAWSNTVNGISGVSLITSFDTTNYRTKIAGQIKKFQPKLLCPQKMIARTDPFIHFGVAATNEAIADSKILEYNNLNKDSIGVIISSGIGGISTITDNNNNLNQHGVRKVSPFFMTGSLSNMLSAYVSIEYGFKGLNYGLVSACATGNHCLGDAWLMIKNNLCDAVIVGSSESPVSPLGLAGFMSMKALSKNNDNPTQASRPFDKNRDGFVMGEGAAILVLEDYQHAKKRGANIYAEIVGYGATADANHITSPCCEGASNSMKMALKTAQLNKENIDYINAHGTSTKLGDINETKAIKQVFADHAYNLNVSSTKSVTGHLLGASAAIEAVFTIKALQTDTIPPTINLENIDQECDLNYTANQAVTRSCKFALSNAFGFGGTNASIIFKKFTK